MPHTRTTAMQAVQTIANNGHDECSGTADDIIGALAGARRGGGTTIKKFVSAVKKSNDSVFRVSIDVGATSGMRWGHVFVVQKFGTDMVIYQSFISSYTLDAWMLGVAAPDMADPRFGPQHQRAVSSVEMAAFLQSIRDCKTAVKTNRSGTDFANEARPLFGGDNKARQKGRLAAGNGVWAFTWVQYHMG